MADLNIKEDLCKAFCGTLAVHRVPAGYAVGTGYEGWDGDDIGFYVVGPDEENMYVIQDDGMCVSALESAGADLGNKSRQAIFSELRDQYCVHFDKATGELKTDSVATSEIGPAALRFMAFMLRVQDLLLTTNERTASTFREEAARMIRDIAGERAEVIDEFVVSPALAEVPADLGIVVKDRPPVAVFFGVSESRVYEALLLQSYAEKANIPCAVMALLETEASVTQRMRQRANNHLEAVPNFRGEELAACVRIVREAIGFDPTLQS
jgi:hypothetical protein